VGLLLKGVFSPMMVGCVCVSGMTVGSSSVCAAGRFICARWEVRACITESVMDFVRIAVRDGSLSLEVKERLSFSLKFASR